MTETKPRFSLIPMNALWEVARVLTFGPSKGYADFGWREKDIHYHADAAFRHLNQYLRGEVLDQESKIHSLAHAAARVLMMLALSLDPQKTDRQLSRDSTKGSV